MNLAHQTCTSWNQKPLVVRNLVNVLNFSSLFLGLLHTTGQCKPRHVFFTVKRLPRPSGRAASTLQEITTQRKVVVWEGVHCIVLFKQLPACYILYQLQERESMGITAPSKHFLRVPC